MAPETPGFGRRAWLLGQRFLDRRFVRDAGGMSLGEGAALVASAIQTVLIARWLGPRDSGLAAVILAYPAVVFAIFEPQSSQAAIRYLSEFQADEGHDRLLTMVRLGYVVDTSLAAASFVAIALTAGLAQRHVVHVAHTALLLILYSAALAFHATTSTSRSVLWSASRFRAVAVERAVSSFVSIPLSLVLVVLGFGVPGVVWAASLGLVIDGVALAVLAAGTTRSWGASWWSSPWASLRGRYREILGFIAYSDIDGLFGLVGRRLDVVILSALRGPTDVGYYRIARAVGTLPGHLIWPLEMTAYPRLAALRTSEGDRSVVGRAREYAWKAGVPLGIGLLASIAVMPIAIPLVAGHQYARSVPATQVFLVGSAVWLGSFWLRPLALTLGFVRFWAVNSGAWVVLAVIGFVWLTPAHGFLAMAYVYAGTQAMQYVTALLGIWVFMRRNRAAVGIADPSPSEAT